MKILVIDDDLDLLQILEAFLGSNGCEVTTAQNGRKGIKALDQSFGLVLCDIKLPDFSGLEILSKIKKLQPHIPVIMITGYSDVKTAVEALRRGAKDYVTKPLFPDEILLQIQEIQTDAESVQNIKQNSKGSKSTQTQTKKVEKQNAKVYVQGESKTMNSLNENLKLVAPTDLSVVILGETGTGKEFVAKRLHELSARSSKPFVALDCGALPTELAGSELFGHKKGAFTGATVDKMGLFETVKGGTLFLDEIGNLKYENQVKLLRVLQEKKVMRLGDTKEIDVDFRLIVATNDSLINAVSNGKFREDLYYRLNEFSLHLPPLSNRGGDIMLFAQHFLKLANEQLNKNVTGFEDEIIEKFQQYKWPGNLREMRNLIKRSVLVAGSNRISKKDVPAEIMMNETISNSRELPENYTLKMVVEAAEKDAIIQTLQKHQFNKSKVAKALDVDRKTLYNKINAYKIEL